MSWPRIEAIQPEALTNSGKRAIVEASLSIRRDGFVGFEEAQLMIFYHDRLKCPTGWVQTAEHLLKGYFYGRKGLREAQRKNPEDLSKMIRRLHPNEEDSFFKYFKSDQ